ncbi:MAG: hypothetical protein H6718_11525 [Polyangiaceae bacterium]|nr:hypothetical protein [Polyangiaceae bacterium]
MSKALGGDAKEQAGRQDPPNTYRDKDGRLRHADGPKKGKFAKDPNAGGSDKPTHYAKEGPYEPAGGKQIKLPDDHEVKMKGGGTKKAKKAAEDRKKHLDEAQKSRDKEAESKRKAEEAREKGDESAAAKHDADAAKHEKKAKEDEQAAREHSEALGDAATEHAVKEMFPPPTEVTEVKKGSGANTFDSVYKIDPPPPDYVIAESKGGAGTNSSSRKGDNPGERYEQGTPEYKNQLLDKQGNDTSALPEQRDMAADVREGKADADYIKVTQPFDKNGDLKETKVSQYEDQSYDADGNPHPKP